MWMVIEECECESECVMNLCVFPVSDHYILEYFGKGNIFGEADHTVLHGSVCTGSHFHKYWFIVDMY